MLGALCCQGHSTVKDAPHANGIKGTPHADSSKGAFHANSVMGAPCANSIKRSLCDNGCEGVPHASGVKSNPHGDSGKGAGLVMVARALHIAMESRVPSLLKNGASHWKKEGDILLCCLPCN